MKQTMLDRLEASALRVARALVRRDTVKLVVTGTLACWDSATDTLYLPSYKVTEDPDSPEATLRYNAWRGLLDHECSHARNTTGVQGYQDGWRKRGWPVGKLHALWHVFEDPWIEAKWMREYPGARRHIHAARTLTIQETGGAAPCWPEYAGKTGQPIGVFGAFIQSILRLNTGLVQRAEVSPDILNLIDQCADILSRFDADSPATSSATNADLTTELWQRLVSLLPPETPPEPPPSSGDSGEGIPSEDESTPGDGDNSGDGDESGDNESGDGDGSGEGAESGVGTESGDGDESGEGDNSGDGDESGEGTGSGQGGSRRGPAGRQADNGQPPDNDDGTRQQSNTGGSSNADPTLKVRELVDGDWSDIVSLSEIVAKGHVDASDLSTLPYTVHPTAVDEWEKFPAKNPSERLKLAKQLQRIRAGASRHAVYLASRLRRVIAAQRMDLRIGCQEDGDDIDLDSAALLATRLDSTRVWEQSVSRRADETFVTVLIDCSGSMGDSALTPVCPRHGEVEQAGEYCTRTYNGKRCGQPLDRSAQTKSAQAVLTSVLLHDALRLSRVPHCVLGYTTSWNKAGRDKSHEAVDPITGRACWSRVTPIHMYEFVAAPGIHDPGYALPLITGQSANADGSSLRAAARYAHAHRGQTTRSVMLVVSDGLPACDDTPMEVQDLARTVTTLADSGVEVYAIGIGLNDKAKQTFSQYYPDSPGNERRAPTGSVCLPVSGGLDRAVLDRLIALFAQGNGRGKKGAA